MAKVIGLECFDTLILLLFRNSSENLKSNIDNSDIQC